MTRITIYKCDNCNTETEKQMKYHVTVTYGKNTKYGDFCTSACAIEFTKKFFETASSKPDDE